MKTVCDGHQAIAELDRSDGDYDLAIVDVVMPGSGGLEVAEHLQSIASPVKILLVSGYSAELANGGADEDLPLLTKPFRRDELLQRVRQLLDG